MALPFHFLFLFGCRLLSLEVVQTPPFFCFVCVSDVGSLPWSDLKFARVSEQWGTYFFNAPALSVCHCCWSMCEVVLDAGVEERPCFCAHTQHRQTDRQTDRQIDRQTDRQTDRQIGTEDFCSSAQCTLLIQLGA
jgi:hypothetical protein